MTSHLDSGPRPTYASGVTSDLDINGESPLERRRQRAFRIQAWLGAGAFVLANLALQQWGGLGGAGPWRLLWAVLPLLPVAWLVIVTVRRVRQLDEYQVKLLVPGLAVGFTATIVAAITIGTLSAAGFAVSGASGWIVAVVGLLSWQVTNLWVGAPTR